jgi:hypothetical protein
MASGSELHAASFECPNQRIKIYIFSRGIDSFFSKLRFLGICPTGVQSLGLLLPERIVFFGPDELCRKFESESESSEEMRILAVAVMITTAMARAAPLTARCAFIFTSYLKID